MNWNHKAIATTMCYWGKVNPYVYCLNNPMIDAGPGGHAETEEEEAAEVSPEETSGYPIREGLKESPASEKTKLFI